MGALLWGSIHPFNTPNIRKGIHPGFRFRAHSHLPGLFLFCETKVFPASIPQPQSRSTQPHPSPRSPRPRCQATPIFPPKALALPALGGLLQLRGSEGRTGEGAARVSYLDGGEVGVAHDPVDGLEVGQVPLRHVHQLGGVYLVGEVGRAVFQRGRVFILVAVFLGMGTEAASLGQFRASSSRRPPGPPPFPRAVQCGRPWGLTNSSLPLLQPIGSPLSTLPTAPSPAKASAPLISTQVQAPSSNFRLISYGSGSLPHAPIVVFIPFSSKP